MKNIYYIRFTAVVFAVLTSLAGFSQIATWKVRPGFQKVEACGDNIWKTMGDDGRWTLRNLSTEQVLAESFDSIAAFRDDLALAFNKGAKGWNLAGIINKSNFLTMKVNGNYHVSEAYPYFCDGMLLVGDGKGKFGYLSANGSLGVRMKKFIKTNPFSEGRALVALKPGKEYYIDKTGKKIKAGAREEDPIILDAIKVEPVYHNDDYKIFAESLFMGYKRDGKEVVVPQFDRVKPFYGNVAAVLKDGKWGLIELKDGEMEVKTTSARKSTNVSVTLPLGLNEDLLDVCLKAPDGTETQLPVEKRTENAILYAVSGQLGNKEIVVKYDGIVQHIDKPKPAPVVVDESSRGGGLVISRVYKSSKKADKNDNEYIAAVIRNTSSSTLSARVIFNVDGVTYTKSVSVKGKKSQTVTTAVKVKKERFAKVSVKLSTGASSGVESIKLNPFY